MSIPEETRRESYSEVISKVIDRRSIVLLALAGGPQTADEITELLYKSKVIKRFERNFVSPRLTELKKLGAIEAIGKRKGLYNDRMQAVWAIKGDADAVL